MMIVRRYWGSLVINGKPAGYRWWWSAACPDCTQAYSGLMWYSAFQWADSHARKFCGGPPENYNRLSYMKQRPFYLSSHVHEPGYYIRDGYGNLVKVGDIPE